MINLDYLKANNIKAGKNPEVVNFIDSLYDSSSKMYLKQHKDWYVNDRFVRGDHWVVFNKTLNKLQAVPISQGEVRRTINKIRSQLRGVKNFIKRNQPRWEVHPNNNTDEAYDEANKKNKILQNIYRKTKLKNDLTDLIVNALKYSVGFLEGGLVKDEEKERIDFWVDSSYDIIPDPYAKSIQDCRFIIKTTVKTIADIKGNPDYLVTDKNLTDNKGAASEYKNILEQEKYNKEGNKTGDDLETAIIKELWLKWVENGEVKIRVYSIAGSNILRVFNPKYRRYPIFAYNPERNEESIFSQPWIKDLISANKSLDKTVSQVESYIQRMLAGKWLVKSGVEVSSITDKGAEKIYYKGNVPPKQMDLQSLPSTPFSFIEKLEQWIEELGGVREACVSDDTEILTKDGWKTYYSINKEDVVYTINTETKNGEWNKLKNIHSYTVTKDLVEIENKNISALVTDNHRWFVKSGRNNYKFLETKDLSTDTKIILSAEIEGEQNKIYDDNFVELVGWVVTEGCYSRSMDDIKRNRQRITISQSKRANIENCNRIDALFKRLEIETKPWLNKYDECYTYSFSKDLAKKIRTEFPNKTLTDDFINHLTKSQLKLLFDVLLLADGNAERKTFYGTEKENIDCFQKICTLLGYNSRMSISREKRKDYHKELYQVRVKNDTFYSGFSSLKRKENFVKTIKYDGLVWCPETENGTWLMRRNGKICFTGNSLGRAAGSLQSGKGIEALQAADAATVAEPVENLELCLQEVGEFILELIADHQIASEEIVEDGQNIKYIGKVADTKLPGTVIISGGDEIKVEIVPEVAYSDDVKKTWIMQLAQAGLIDKQTLLEFFKFTNVGDIIDRLDKQQAEEFKQQLTMQDASHKSADGGGTPQDSAELADQENMKMASGQDVQPTPKVLWQPEHTQLHMAFIKENADAYRQNQELFDNHITAEEAYGQGDPQEQPQEQSIIQ